MRSHSSVVNIILDRFVPVWSSLEITLLISTNFPVSTLSTPYLVRVRSGLGY